MVVGCATTPKKDLFAHYDECHGPGISFVAMVDCSKAKRAAYCRAEQICSPTGDLAMAYADTLAQSVAARAMTEPEVERRWIEFRLARTDEARREALRRATIAAGAGPITCARTSATTTCF
jgi:hypothetical protein